jgi:tRNA(Ile)-lysidine synthase
MQDQVYSYMEKEHMLDGTDTVVVGVSGGADSVCLLALLAEYAKTHPLTVIAAHVHHGLRENADLDEIYVKEYCEKLQVKLHTLHIDAAKEAENLGISVEEAGRVKRYAFFEELAEKSGENTRIAVAHHRDDQCETMLFQLFRGSGVHGLRGILPVTGKIIRPLLCVSKEEICAYLKEKNISWREDESNGEDIYARNRIRHEILPVAEQICPKASEHIEEAAERLRDAEEFIAMEAAKAKKLTAVYNSESGQIRIGSAITEYPAILRREVLLSCLQEVSGKKRDIGSAQVAALEDLFTSQVGKERQLIYGIRAKRTYEGITLSPSLDYFDLGLNIDFEEEYSIQLDEEPVEIVTSDGMTVEYEIMSKPSGEIPKGEDRKWFDLNAVREEALLGYVTLRHPKRSDFLVINRDGEKQPVYDFFKNAKIPEEERDGLWVLATDVRVLWIIGYRMGEYAKITDGTREVLEIRITKG